MDGTEAIHHEDIDADAAMCVLASGSRGNCTVLRIGRGRDCRVVLIDAGLSPRRTGQLLEQRGLRLDDIDEAIFTHLDSDHCHAGWRSPRAAPHMRITVFRGHRGRAERMGILYRRTRVFDEPFDIAGGVASAGPIVAAHDSLGVAAFRFLLPGGATLGFATDVGRAHPPLVEHMRGVATLAIESNYCPRMQEESDRPYFLKRRITGGSGHLSNQECVEAVRRIGPGRRVVLLHLSQQCNEPGLASAGHVGAPYEVTVTRQDEPTGWIPLEACEPARPSQTNLSPGSAVAIGATLPLFGDALVGCDAR